MITIELQKANGEHVTMATVDVSPVGLMPQCVRFLERIFAVSEWEDDFGGWIYREVTVMDASKW